MKTNDNALVGRKITSIERSGDATVIFKTDKGDVTLRFEPDCCSSAFVYGIKGDITGKVVTRVETDVREDVEKEKTVLDRIKKIFGDECLQESNSIWGVDVYAGKKRLRVLHCNSSNGYYDSWANWSA
jgi:hypothetical protein